MRRYRSKPGTPVWSAWIPPELSDRLDAVCVRHDLNRVDLIREALAHWADWHGSESRKVLRAESERLEIPPAQLMREALAIGLDHIAMDRGHRKRRQPDG